MAAWTTPDRLTPEEVYTLLDPDHPMDPDDAVDPDFPYEDLSPVYADHGPFTRFWGFLRSAVTPGW